MIYIYLTLLSITSLFFIFLVQSTPNNLLSLVSDMTLGMFRILVKMDTSGCPRQP